MRAQMQEAESDEVGVAVGEESDCTTDAVHFSY